MNEDISKAYINYLINTARENNINMFDIYYNNNKLFELILIFYTISFTKGILNYIDKNQKEILKYVLQIK